MIIENQLSTQIVHFKNKNLLTYFVLLLGIVFSIHAKGETTPPQIVLNSFHQFFPTAKKSKWINTEVKNKEYKVNFKVDNKLMIGYFDTNGKLIETEKEIDAKSVPEKVLNSLLTQYENYNIIKAMEILQDNKVVSYELIIKSDGLKSTFVVSKDGFFTAR